MERIKYNVVLKIFGEKNKVKSHNNEYKQWVLSHQLH
jgi:hypothetical protein